MKAEDTERISGVLRGCIDALRGGKLSPDHAVALSVMAGADELAVQACEIMDEKLERDEMALLRIHIIRVLGMRYEDSVVLVNEKEDLFCGDEAGSGESDLYMACSILNECFDLAHLNEADGGIRKLRLMAENHRRVQEFAGRIGSVRSGYGDVKAEMWGRSWVK